MRANIGKIEQRGARRRRPYGAREGQIDGERDVRGVWCHARERERYRVGTGLTGFEMRRRGSGRSRRSRFVGMTDLSVRMRRRRVVMLLVVVCRVLVDVQP